MVIRPSILAWRIPWTESGGLQSMGHKEPDTTGHTHCHAGTTYNTSFTTRFWTLWIQESGFIHAVESSAHSRHPSGLAELK